MITRENNEELYERLKKIYKFILENYISSKLKLNEVENYLDTLDFGFIKSGYKKENKFNYFEILNEIYIERLKEEDINLLMNFSGIVDEKYLDLMKRTIKEILSYKNDKYKDKRYKINYKKNDDPKYFAYNDALVLDFIYAKKKMKLTNEEFVKREMDTEKLIRVLEKEINFKMHTITNMDVVIIANKKLR